MNSGFLTLLVMVYATAGFGQVVYYFEKTAPYGTEVSRYRYREEVPDYSDIEWSLYERGGKVFFEGYCKNLKKSSRYVERPDTSGCRGVDAGRFYQNLRSTLGLKADRKMNQRRSGLLLKEGFGEGAVPSLQQGNVEKGIDELRRSFMVGSEDAACLDGNSNSLADLELTCASLRDAFKNTAATEYQHQFGREIKSGFFVDKTSYSEAGANSEDHFLVSGLLLSDYHSRFCRLTLTSTDSFQLNCISKVTEKNGSGPQTAVTNATYQCDLNSSDCHKVVGKADHSLFPPHFKILDDGSLFYPNENYLTLEHLLPLKEPVTVYYETSSSYRFQKDPGHFPKPHGGLIPMRYHEERHTDYLGGSQYDGYNITEAWGIQVDLGAILK